MKVTALIPARLNSQRLPGKMLKYLGNKTLIRRTYENVCETTLFDEVFVVTDHEDIYNEITSHGGMAIMSTRHHLSGSDRIAEATEGLDTEIIINVQGDEPFVNQESLSLLISSFQDKEVKIASLMQEIKSEERFVDPNVVKVIVDKDSYSIYFSRHPIPYRRNVDHDQPRYEHIGIYAYRKQALIDFSKQSILQNEFAESIEAIRVLEYGQRIKMIKTTVPGIKIDTHEDLIKAELYLQNLESSSNPENLV